MTKRRNPTDHRGQEVWVPGNGKVYRAKIDSKGRRTFLGEEPPRPKPGRKPKPQDFEE